MNLVNIGRLAWDIEYKRNIKKASTKQLGQFLKKRLPELGPSFIKIGQFISTRDDIFPKDLAKELSSLQDDAPPIKTQYVERILSTAKVKTFDIQPIASASIGQVHIGYLQDGTKVAIKIKRPNIDQDLKNDFGFFLNVLSVAKLFSDNRRILELFIVFQEYYNVLMEEIDYKREVQNMKVFAQNYKDTTWVKVPTVYDELCDDQTIVMEYVENIKIDNLPSQYSPEMCKKALMKVMEFFVGQITKHGFVHIDPHPGNLSITPQGKLVLFDYGMVMDLQEERFAENFDKLLLYLFERNADALSEFLVENGIVEVLPGNMSLFKSFVRIYLLYTESMDIEEFKANYLKQLDGLGGMPFFLSSKYVMLLRGLAILEGISRKLDPNFNYKDNLEPFVSSTIMNISYLESRATTDINTYKNLPSTMEMAQLQIDVLEKRLEQQQTYSGKTNLFIITGLLAAMILHLV